MNLSQFLVLKNTPSMQGPKNEVETSNTVPSFMQTPYNQIEAYNLLPFMTYIPIVPSSS
jgi:hypothetical protein